MAYEKKEKSAIAEKEIVPWYCTKAGSTQTFYGPGMVVLAGPVCSGQRVFEVFTVMLSTTGVKESSLLNSCYVLRLALDLVLLIYIVSVRFYFTRTNPL